MAEEVRHLTATTFLPPSEGSDTQSGLNRGLEVGFCQLAAWSGGGLGEVLSTNIGFSTQNDHLVDHLVDAFFHLVDDYKFIL
jgi:hypothetical protein